MNGSDFDGFLEAFTEKAGEMSRFLRRWRRTAEELNVSGSLDRALTQLALPKSVDLTSESAFKARLADFLWNYERDFCAELSELLKESGFPFEDLTDWQGVKGDLAQTAEARILRRKALSLHIDFKAESAAVFIGRADTEKHFAAKSAKQLAEAFLKWYGEMKSRSLNPEETARRLRIAFSLAVGKSGRRSCALEELLPYMRRFALMKSAFAKNPTAANLDSCGRVQLLYEASLLSERPEGGAVIEDSPEELNWKSLVSLN